MVYLHAHDGEYEDDDSEYEAEVAERSERSTDDVDKQVQRRPRLGQFEHSQLHQSFHWLFKRVCGLAIGARQYACTVFICC